MMLILFQVYVHQTFRRLGPPPGVIKIYWNFMAVQVCIQLGVYTLAVAAGLFLDQLVNGPISVYTDRRALYLALCIGTLVFFVPYLLSVCIILQVTHFHMLMHMSPHRAGMVSDARASGSRRFS